jgi:hypothetical protein
MPFTGGIPNPQQIALANSAADNIIRDEELPHEADAIIRKALATISQDNQWVVEAVRDFSGTSEQTRSLVRSSYNYGQDVPVSAHYLVRALGSAIIAFSFLNELRINSDDIYVSTIYTLSAPDYHNEVDPTKIISTVIAATVLSDFYTSREEDLVQHAKLLREAASGIESRLEEVLPILPELFARKTLDPEVIDMILWGRALGTGGL